MKVIVRPRTMGKTTDLLEFARKNKYLIITHNYQEAERLWKIINGNPRMLDDDGYEMFKPVSWESVVNGCGVKGLCPIGYVIDDVNIILENTIRRAGLVMSEFGGMTISGVPEYDYRDEHDCDQWEEFRQFNPKMSYREFCSFKYGVEINDETQKNSNSGRGYVWGNYVPITKTWEGRKCLKCGNNDQKKFMLKCAPIDYKYYYTSMPYPDQILNITCDQCEHTWEEIPLYDKRKR